MTMSGALGILVDGGLICSGPVGDDDFDTRRNIRGSALGKSLLEQLLTDDSNMARTLPVSPLRTTVT